MDIRNVLVILLLVAVLYVVVLNGLKYNSKKVSYEDEAQTTDDTNVIDESDNTEVAPEPFVSAPTRHALVLRDHTDDYDMRTQGILINGDGGMEGNYGECVTTAGQSGVIRPYGCESMTMEYPSRPSNDVLKNVADEVDEYIYPYSDKIHEGLDMVVDNNVRLEYSILTPHMNTFNNVNTEEGNYRAPGMPKGDMDLEGVSSAIETANEKHMDSLLNGPEFTDDNLASDPDKMYY